MSDAARRKLPSLAELTDAEFTALTQGVLAGRHLTIAEWWSYTTCEHVMYHDIGTMADPYLRLCASACGRTFHAEPSQGVAPGMCSLTNPGRCS